MRKTNPERHEPQADEASGGKQHGVRVGNMIVLAQPNEQRLESFTHRLLAQSYRVRETPHFVVCHEPAANKSLLMHRFSQAEIDADLITLIEQELPNVGLLTSPQEYATVLFAVLASTFPAPRNQALIWRHFCLNTLARLRVLIAQAPEPFHTAASHVVPFAAIYKRVMELVVGNSLLDVGSSFGFLPVLMAERASNMSLVGCDINPDALRCSTDLAAVSQMNQVTFLLRDVLSADFPAVGHFDTVTAVHLLEHLTEEELPVALAHLLHVAARRLLIAVPYEEQAQPLYGHQQTFTPEKLDYWGKWCVERRGGAARYHCEEVMGGLLIIDCSSDQREGGICDSVTRLS
ncbi:MAG: methyltransferase domain-containing protein [Ktedonobacteraceae bacterium]